ncbi:hypothetical protein [Massilia sp. CCM 8734]|uniref:hypothetical protein n=1 Tax=Massilia sp. CCM 8734 TaxID=2609283 RepID=UPI0014201E06|nr:hypothetical protein [Massilia sp. CCM 8734]
MALSLLANDTATGIPAPRQMVIRDAATLATVWAEHHAGRVSVAPAPKVFFDHEMVIALFGGAGGACHKVGLRSLRVSGDKLVAAYRQADQATNGAACDGLPGAAMEMMVIDRSDAAIVFEALASEDVPFRQVVRSQFSAIGEARQLVIKDAQSLAALWKEHNPPGPLPGVDFSKQMVVAAFLGSRGDGSFSIEIGSIERIGGRLRVTTEERTLGRHSQLIPAAFGPRPVVMVVLDKSDEPVEFVSQIMFYR